MRSHNLADIVDTLAEVEFKHLAGSTLAELVCSGRQVVCRRGNAIPKTMSCCT